ncbi:MAG: RNA pseudouridine synthase [Bacteroidetes bacterium]|nr:MAG: RNA pseudouridine synthase [Bacteroidota bacterium]
MMEIIFENSDYLVVNKPAGLITEVNPFESPTVESLVFDYLSGEKKKPFVGVVHRLDRVTSGVMVFAKKKSILKKLNILFQEKQVRKTYWAITERLPGPSSGTLGHYLFKDQKNKRAEIFPGKHKGAKPCKLEYKLLKESNGLFLLEIKPLTGRFHQIRAQLAFVGCPIIGDEKYGSTTEFPRLTIGLHARELSFSDLEKGRGEVSYTAALPDHFPISI